MKIKKLEEAMRIERLDHDDYLDAVIKFRDEFNKHPNAPILEAAQTMLELMKAREGATGGEWFKMNYQKGDVPSYTMTDCAQICSTDGDTKAIVPLVNDYKFITLAANLTRETN